MGKVLPAAATLNRTTTTKNRILLRLHFRDLPMSRDPRTDSVSIAPPLPVRPPQLRPDKGRGLGKGGEGLGEGRSNAGIRRKDQFASMGGGSQKAEPERPAGGAGALEPQAHQD